MAEETEGWACPAGHPNGAMALFCTACGTPQQPLPGQGRVCASGHDIADEHAFCPTCGAPPGAPAPPHPDPNRRVMVSLPGSRPRGLRRGGWSLTTTVTVLVVTNLILTVPFTLLTVPSSGALLVRFAVALLLLARLQRLTARDIGVCLVAYVAARVLGYEVITRLLDHSVLNFPDFDSSLGFSAWATWVGTVVLAVVVLALLDADLRDDLRAFVLPTSGGVAALPVLLILALLPSLWWVASGAFDGPQDFGVAAHYEAAPPLPTPEVETPNLRCARDVYGAASDIDANGDVGLQRELAVGGRNNPVFDMAIAVQGVYRQSLYTVGAQAASGVAVAKARELCEARGNPNNDAFGGTPYQP